MLCYQQVRINKMKQTQKGVDTEQDQLLIVDFLLQLKTNKRKILQEEKTKKFINNILNNILNNIINLLLL